MYISRAVYIKNGEYVADGHDFSPSSAEWMWRWRWGKRKKKAWRSREQQMTGKTNAPRLNGANNDRGRGDVKPSTHIERGIPSLSGERQKKKRNRGERVTLFAAEEGSDIISRQLRSFSFHFSVVLLSSLSPVRAQHSGGSSSSGTRRRRRRRKMRRRRRRKRSVQSQCSACCCGRISCFCHIKARLVFVLCVYLLAGSMAVAARERGGGEKTSFVCVCFPFTGRQRVG